MPRKQPFNFSMYPLFIKICFCFILSYVLMTLCYIKFSFIGSATFLRSLLFSNFEFFIHKLLVFSYIFIFASKVGKEREKKENTERESLFRLCE